MTADTQDPQALLFAALAAAQGQATDAKLDSVNPGFKSRYASLASVLERTRPVLAANGLCLLMAPVREDGHAGVDWTLGHTGGASLTGRVLFRLAQDTPQGAGSAITYARRYTYSAILGIAADDDDDGNAGSLPSKPQPTQKATSATPTRSEAKRGPEPAQATQAASAGDLASNEQKRALFAAVSARGLDADNKQARIYLADEVLGPRVVTSFATITRAQASAMIDALQGPDQWPDIRLRAIWKRATPEASAQDGAGLFDQPATDADDPFVD